MDNNKEKELFELLKNLQAEQQILFYYADYDGNGTGEPERIKVKKLNKIIEKDESHCFLKDFESFVVLTPQCLKEVLLREKGIKEIAELTGAGIEGPFYAEIDGCNHDVLRNIPEDVIKAAKKIKKLRNILEDRSEFYEFDFLDMDGFQSMKNDELLALAEKILEFRRNKKRKK